MKLAGPLAAGLVLAACGPPGPATETPHQTAIATPVLTLAERDLLPENIAFDPLAGVFYVGSTRHGKIVEVDASGRSSDFTTPRQDGLWMVMGLKVDSERRHLWVASSDGDNLAGHQPGRGQAAGLFLYDLESRLLIRKWVLDDPGSKHFFNDLAAAPDGTVYVTHMFGKPAIHVLDGAAGELAVFARPGNFRGPNGITVAPSGTVYVAHREGVSAFDPATARRTLLAFPAGAALSPIDGLYHHGDALLSFHPDEGTIRRLELAADGLSVTAVETLFQQDPADAHLTTGVLVGDALYFIADSQFDRLREGALPADAELDEITILKLDLE